ncbi:hypothetical protein PRUB_b0319 [Pseudoalteromonas rubra]|uniref:Uncharacterized protein n=1 Tax=Pseudoalteromonas rubra TaxID=43658 RepID=A0A8T0C1Q6_9GAMM|nr:hypothetical protein [Pseudoalteromonas rubra]KAF7781178.1 hypothetical protein PRUB_b0319 [Pseudoalteromonas rubra]
MKQKSRQLLHVFVVALGLIFSIIYKATTSENEHVRLEEDVSKLLLKDGDKAKLLYFYESTDVTSLDIGVEGFSRSDALFEEKKNQYKVKTLNFVCSNNVLKKYLDAGAKIIIDLTVGENLADIIANLHVTSARCSRLGL